MTENVSRAVAVVGVGAVLPDAPNAPAFWENLKAGRYSITETPPGRWDPALYYDPDPHAPDKTYSNIGGWVREFDWSPLEWRLPVPPRVSDAMDRGQKWSVGACREALLDYGYPDRALDTERTAVVLGNAMAGDRHYLTALPIYLPEYLDELDHVPSFAALPASARQAVVEELREAIHRRLPGVTEDSMPGELGNIIAGRVANLLNLRGPNFIVDAACASALAALDAAIEGLERGAYDAVLTGGVDANMSASTFVKFCKIGALSATGTRPYYDGADGFVMGEGAAVVLLKRLVDAEQAGDHIYGVIRGVAGASDGKGKGITAPNPVGQRLAVARAWKDAGRVPDSATYVEGHGTSTKVGDVVEVESLSAVFAGFGLPPGSMPLGSVKSNIGHLKSSAGAAGLLKALYALDEKVIPPSLGGTVPNPNIDFSRSPLYINDELREWKTEPGLVRSVGVSAFGFGGTNFHAVVEEYVPGRIQPEGAPKMISLSTPADTPASTPHDAKAPLRGAIVIGGATEADVLARAREIQADAVAGRTPPRSAPADADLRAAVRLVIDFGDAAELAAKADRAIKALEADQPAMWRALRNQGVFLGRGAPAPVAFLYTGQGSQYVNMLASLRDTEPIVADTFAEADKVMTPLLGRPLSEYLFVDSADPVAVAEAGEQLRQTEITQPAILTVDTALARLLAAYGIEPDMVMGHSLGEYGALIASGALSFAAALEAVSARGREMAQVAVEDCGRMAAVFAPLEEIEHTLAEVEGYVVIANINSHTQAVIGGASAAVEAAVARLSAAGHQAIMLPVSHAFHTEIVAPAAEPLKATLRRLRIESPAIPLVANVDGAFYPMGPNVVDRMIDLLGRQIASPVQFIKGLRTLYDAGCRVFVEIGPKRALHGFVEEVLGDDPEVVAMFSNHPKQGDITSFNQALCGLYAAGLGAGTRAASAANPAPVPTSGSAAATDATPMPAIPSAVASDVAPPTPTPVATMAEVSLPRPDAVAAPVRTAATGDDTYMALGRMFADVLTQGNQLLGQVPATTPLLVPVVVTGAGLGLPGGERVFGDDKVPSILAGEQLIDTIPVKQRDKMVDKHITRLVKTEGGGARFEAIESSADVIKLAGRPGAIDLVEEFGFSAERAEALDVTSMLAIGAGLDALRDAGIPLVMHYKTATTGRMLPERWMLPEAYRDTTGVIFASAFPGYDSLVGELERYHRDQALAQRLEDLRGVRARLAELGGGDLLADELDHRIHVLATELEAHPYHFDRKFLFHALSMGHSQFAEYVGARGPNTQVNSACASTTQAVALAEDWIRVGRCERVVIVSGDNVTSNRLLEWMGAGFLASGAAATDDVVAEAAVPFDLRRHGMILGMGAAAIVVEAATSAQERGVQPIAEVLGTVTANSAFHGTRLDPKHISQVMEDLVATAEQQWGIDRYEIAPHTVFISHETYTPARGGSAQAEIDAVRRVFGASAGQVVISNTKGFTGHAMGVGVEDVVAIKAIETGIVPPVPNYKMPDPALGELNLSLGGTYPVRYALRLAAGFGSQVSMTLYRLVPAPSGRHPEPDQLGFEYRIVDPEVWQSWLVASCGLPSAATEISKRTLRIRDDGPPALDAPAMPAAAAAKPLAGSVASPPRSTVLPAPALEAEAPPAPAPVAPVAVAPAAVAPAAVAPAVVAAAAVAAVPVAATPAAPAPVAAAPVAAAPAVPAPVAAAPAAPAPVAAAPVADDGVEQQVLAIVAGQTGYPSDLLDLDLDLEADLGIDTVKQAETFAAIRAAYDIERDDRLALREYPTLRHVIAFVYERAPRFTTTTPAAAPEAAAPAAPAPVAAPVAAAPVAATPVAAPPTAPAPVAAAPVAAAPAAAAPAADDGVEQQVLAIVAGQTGYPSDLLDLDLDLEADLGIDTVKQAETFAAIRAAYDIERDDRLALREYPTLRHVIAFVYERAPRFTTPAALVAAAPAAVAPAPVAAPAAVAPVAAAPPTAPAPVAAAPVAAAPAAAAPAADDGVEQQVLAIVAGQTGYPSDLLDLDLDLEADLGIDTVKQAETFAAIRAAYDIERDDRLALREYPTLRHVIAFVYERAPRFTTPAALVAAAPAAVAPAPVAAPAAVAPVAAAPPTAPAPVAAAPVAAAPAAAAPAADDGVEQQVLAIVAGQTGYPSDLLDLDLDLEADLGIDTVKQAETFAAIRAAYDIERDDRLALREYPTLRHVIAFVYERAPRFTTTTPAAAPEAAAPAAPAPVAAPVAAAPVAATPVAAPPTAPAPVAAAPVAAAPAAAAPAADDGVEQQVLAIVAGQTGYPSDLLDLDLDLEADLGIDTVKQAETFAAIRAAYDIERDDRLALREYPTLRHVIAFVYERAPRFTTTTPAAAPVAATPPAAVLVEGVDAEAAAIPRRIPTAVLRPSLELCQPTGLALGEGSRVMVMLDEGGSGSALTSRLEQMGVAVLAIEGSPPAEELAARLDSFASAGPISGVYWLAALDAEPPLGELDLVGWRELLRRRVKLLYACMRHLGEAVGGPGTFLVSATRLGGGHGYDTGGAEAPMGGAVTGFTKAFRREHPDALVKAVDVELDATPDAVAGLLVDETLLDPGAVEVGHRRGRRWTVALREVPLDTADGITLGPDTVFVITGAAGSIVTAITADLARASQGTFHLLDLIPRPDPADADLGAFVSDKDGLKRTIFERLKAAGERATPALVDKELARIERAHAALSALRAIEAAGGRVHYHSVDLRDGDAVEAVVQGILGTSGRVDVLVHAAGLEVSRRLADKTPEEYDLVFDVKADGWFNLLHGLGDQRLAAAVVFSSIAGRFGNAGQTDYSAANDLLCKEISSFERTRPGTLGIAIDWTAWADIGMATRGSIPTVMKAAGIDMLPARAGIPIVRRELTLRASGGEVLIGQRLGMLADEVAPAGGLDVSPGGPVAKRVGDGSALFSEVVGWPIGSGLTVLTTLDPGDQPFLHDHQIDGTPVLPGVMGVEAFAEAALLLHPDRHIAAVEDMEFLAPFKFYRHEPRQLTVTCQFTAEGDDLLAWCTLSGSRILPNRPEPEVKVHFTGMVRLATSPPELAPAAGPAPSETAVAAQDIYQIYFHGPAYQVLEQAWAYDGVVAGRFAPGLPPAFHPENRSLATAPRLLELAFQTAGVWEIGTTGMMNLPMRLDRVVFAVGPESADPITAMVRRGDGEAAATVVDGAGRALVELSGYRTIGLPGAIDEVLVAPLRRACRPTS